MRFDAPPLMVDCVELVPITFPTPPTVDWEELIVSLSPPTIVDDPAPLAM
jgi:hypothetical protein